MGVEPPFIYDKPSSYTFGGPTQRPFNPKAATQASWAPPIPKVQRDGPLIDFNKHPDSYITVPYGSLTVQPMPPQTKTRVKRCRRGQHYLRILAFLASLGALFCVIAITKTTTAVAWIIRVGPAVALCHTLYANYHFERSATSRPPASTASYHLFAGLLDAGLIPFFAFSAYMAQADYFHNTYGWDTLFGNDAIDYKIILAFFIISTVIGSVFIVSLVLDVYLAVIFRKIAAMPPDMNPLEDNLTARPNGKHKRNKSELHYEKHLSGSTLAAQRFSQQANPSIAGRRVPFIHTRTDSVDRSTLYGNESARDSGISLRKDLVNEMSDPYGARMSIASSHEATIPPRPGSAVTPAANARQAGAGLDYAPNRSSGLVRAGTTNARPASWLSYVDYEGVPTDLSQDAQNELDSQVRPISPVSSMSSGDYVRSRPPVTGERRNWYQTGEQKSRAHLPLADRPQTPDDHVYDDENNHHDNSNATNSGHLAVPPTYTPPKRRSRDPLGMNPPTPVIAQLQDEDVNSSPYRAPSVYSTPPPSRPAFREAEINANTTTPSSGRPNLGSRPSSFIGSGGKSRYYGNLRESIGGSPTRMSHDDITHNQHYHGHHDHHNHERDETVHRSDTVKTDDSGNFQVYGTDSDDDDDDDDDEAYEAQRRQHAHHIEAIRRDQEAARRETEEVRHSGEASIYHQTTTDDVMRSPILYNAEIRNSSAHYNSNHNSAIHSANHSNSNSNNNSSTEYSNNKPGQQHRNGTRQVSSSTGYDLHSGYAGLGAEFGRGMGRRREVSGKMAEEGRVDGFANIGTSEHKDGAVVTGQPKQGAAGWARFKGL